jgi:alpha-L-fucosidase
MRTLISAFSAITIVAALTACQSNQPTKAPPPRAAATQTAPAAAGAVQPEDHRMDWWRDARFGMFIHWGLYSIPAGEWNGHTNYGEWIRTEGKIPVEQYEKFRDQFNPVKFDADAWVALAKAAGMKYIVITTKHHDGFCLFDSKYTDWDVMNTPYHKDIMKQMADACRKQGIKMCWYHSIMDWHNPDYTPRRDWERDIRPTTGADFDRFNQYLKNQVGELLTNYGPIGVMWFDGQWEGTWTHERGQDLAAHVRKLQPNVIINNRVDKGGGQFGMTKSTEYAGDFGTPEQEIPPTGFPGVDWETCMTMNNHWGYNKNDKNFKSTEDLIRKLADIASKGGNFLLNVGPTSEGEIPPESIERLHEIAKWMEVNGDSIHGTQAGPFQKLEWGRCTQKTINADGREVTRLFLHVFSWPTDRQLRVPGLLNQPLQAMVLGDRGYTPLQMAVHGADVIIQVPSEPLSKIDTVVYLDVAGKADVATAPVIESDADIFVGQGTATVKATQQNVVLRYTLDGSEPTPKSPEAKGPITLANTCTLTAQGFRGEKPISPLAQRTFTKADPLPALQTFAPTVPGIHFSYYEGDWDKLPDFAAMKPALDGRVTAFDRKPRKREDRFGFRYTGYVQVPKDAAYTFWTDSDDGSNLYIDGKWVVNNDGLHSIETKSGTIPLAKGLHTFTLDFFEKGGGHELEVWWAAPGMNKRKLPASELFSDQ